MIEDGAQQGLFRLNGRAEDDAQILMASVHGAMLSARALGQPGLFLTIVNPQLARLRAAN